MTGLSNASSQQQLLNFHTALQRQGGRFPNAPKNWFFAFQKLIDFLEAGPQAKSSNGTACGLLPIQTKKLGKQEGNVYFCDGVHEAKIAEFLLPSLNIVRFDWIIFGILAVKKKRRACR
jgi:hypothetical protein